MSDPLNRAERYRALAEEYRSLAATSSSADIRDRYLRMADSLSLAECYCALAEEYRSLAATNSSAEIRDSYLRAARRITAARLSPKNQAGQPTTMSRQAMATENALNTVTSRFPKPWRIVEIPNGFAVEDTTGRQLGVFYGRTEPETAGHTGFLTIDEARQIAVDFASLPEPLKQTSDRSEIAISPEDDKFAKLEVNRSLQHMLEASGLSHYARLPSAASLPSVEMPTAISNPISFGGSGWESTPLLRRPGDPLSNRVKFLIATAVAALPAGYFIFGNSDRSVDVTVAPQATADVPSVEFLPSRRADAPSANATGAAFVSRAEPEVQTSSSQSPERLNAKPTESRIEARPPRTFPEVQTSSSQSRERSNAEPTESGIEVKPPRKVPEVQTSSLQPAERLEKEPTESGIEARPPRTFPERGGRSFAASRDASTCFPSASAVRQNSPGAWPAWTLRALGHEGTRCWYAASRFTAHGHRSEMRRTEPPPTIEELQFPDVMFDGR